MNRFARITSQWPQVYRILKFAEYRKKKTGIEKKAIFLFIPLIIKKAIKDITERVQAVAETRTPYLVTPASKEDMARLIKELESQMKTAARNLEFEKAALLRDRIIELKKGLVMIAP